MPSVFCSGLRKRLLEYTSSERAGLFGEVLNALHAGAGCHTTLALRFDDRRVNARLLWIKSREAEIEALGFQSLTSGHPQGGLIFGPDVALDGFLRSAWSAPFDPSFMLLCFAEAAVSMEEIGELGYLAYQISMDPLFEFDCWTKARLVSSVVGLPILGLDELEECLVPEFVAGFEHELLLRLGLLPLRQTEEGRLLVAATRPDQPWRIEEFKVLSGVPAEFGFVLSERDLELCLEAHGPAPESQMRTAIKRKLLESPESIPEQLRSLLHQPLIHLSKTQLAQLDSSSSIDLPRRLGLSDEELSLLIERWSMPPAPGLHLVAGARCSARAHYIQSLFGALAPYSPAFIHTSIAPDSRSVCPRAELLSRLEAALDNSRAIIVGELFEPLVLECALEASVSGASIFLSLYANSGRDALAQLHALCAEPTAFVFRAAWTRLHFRG